MALNPNDLDGHDGNLVAIAVRGFSGGPREPRRTLDRHAGAASRRRDAGTTGEPKRILIHGDLDGPVKNSGAGNVDPLPIDDTPSAEIPGIIMFGGMIEAEATTFNGVEAAQ